MSFLNILQSNEKNQSNTFQNNAGMITISCSGDSLQLPILPSSFEVSVTNQNSTININSFGELNMMGKTGLKSIKFDAFFPAQKYSFCVTNPETPFFYVNKIEKWRTSGDYVKVFISDTNISMKCLIENFTYSERDGSRDVYYSIEFKEYRDIKSLSTSEVDSMTGLNERTIPTVSKQEVQVFSINDNLKDLKKVIGRTQNAGYKQQETYIQAFKRFVKEGFPPGKINAIGGKICGL